MKAKKLRHFLFGLFFGASIIYWYSLYGQDSLDAVLVWLEDTAEEYRSGP